MEIDSDGRNLLHKAVIDHDLSLIKKLSSTTEMILHKDHSGISPLHLAVLLGNLDITQHFIEILYSSFGDKITISAISNNSGRSVLHSSISKQRHPITNLIIAWNPALVNAPDKYGWTPLHVAASLGDITSLELVLNNGGDLQLLKTSSR